jgi:single-strand DNA-binding protein
LAVNRRWQNRQTNEWEEATSFFDIVCWRDLAEHVAESLNRGSRVMVMGRMEQRSWETQDGDKRSKVEVVADEVGPSLRWATAQVTKSQRTGGESGGYNGGNNNASSNNNSGNSNNYATANAGAQTSGGDPGWGQDEEPF